MSEAWVLHRERGLPATAQPDLPEGLSLRPTAGPCGYELRGIDLAAELDGDTIGSLVWLVNHCGLLVVPGQHGLTPERQAEITAWLGRPFVRGLFSDGVDRMATVADTPVQILGSQARDEGSNVAAADVDDGKKLGPHSDVQDSEIPPAITMLHGVEVPPSSAGGNTYFTNLYDAYELLDEVMRRKLRRASWRPASTQATAYGVGMQAAKNDVAARGLVAESKVCHPVIRTHPVTLRKALWISTFTQEIYGLPEEDDAEAVLALLKEHVNAPERWYRHEWRAQDVLFWDNRCMNHWREGWDPALRRTVHRSQADGSRPF